VNLLLEAVRLLALALLGSTHVAGERGVATRFGDPGDPLDGAHLSCTHKKMAPGQLVCAHRTLPCGTPLVVQNIRTGRFGVCQVLDRGPFGATLPSGKWVFKIRPNEPGDWRGVLDMSPAVADALAFNGREPVRIFYRKHARHRRARRGGPPLH
jgi:hypothetical protein